MTPLPDFLEQYRPVPHPLRDFFRDKCIGQAVLSNYLGCSQSWTSQVLCGARKMPRHMEARLMVLKDRLEQG